MKKYPFALVALALIMSFLSGNTALANDPVKALPDIENSVFPFLGAGLVVSHAAEIEGAATVAELAASAGAVATALLVGVGAAASGAGGYLVGKGLVKLDEQYFHGAGMTHLVDGIEYSVAVATNLKKDIMEEASASPQSHKAASAAAL